MVMQGFKLYNLRSTEAAFYSIFIAAYKTLPTSPKSYSFKLNTEIVYELG